jgi:hypothetical protein
LFFCCFSFFHFSMPAQELSLHIPLSNKNLDGALQIISLTDGYLMMGQSNCVEDRPLKTCLGLHRVDHSGSVVWQRAYPGEDDLLALRPNGRTMTIQDSIIFVATEGFVGEDIFIRMMAFRLADGELLYEQDHEFWPRPTAFFTTTLVPAESSELILAGHLRYPGLGEVFLLRFDRTLNLLQDRRLGQSPSSKRESRLDKGKQGGYLLAYKEFVFNTTVVTMIAELDEDLEIVQAREVPETYTGRPSSSPNLLDAPDGGYYLVSEVDYWDSIPLNHAQMWLWPTCVYKLGPAFELEWQYAFTAQGSAEHISAKLTAEGHVFGVGATDYFDFFNVFYPDRRSLDGWCFLLDVAGNLLWERRIADIRGTKGGRFWDGLQTGQGFAIAGVISRHNPTGVPFNNDPDVWFLTLDENGCWNGNCSDIIVIDGDSTSYTNAKELPTAGPPSKAYPNPTAGMLTLEREDAGFGRPRLARVADLSGRVVAEIALHAPKAILNLSGLPAGAYILTEWREGELLSTHKVIVQP